jgi:hypothetical protein
MLRLALSRREPRRCRGGRSGPHRLLADVNTSDRIQHAASQILPAIEADG